MVQHNLNNGSVLSFLVVFSRLNPSARPMRPIRHERRPCTSTTPFTTVTLVRLRPLGDDGEQRLQPGLELLVLPPHAAPVVDELPRRAPRVRPVRLRRREVALGCPRLDAVLPAERRPQSGEPGGLEQRLVVDQRSAVVGEVGRVFLHRVVGGEDGQDGVHGAEHGLVHGVDGVDEHVDAGELAGTTGRIEVLVEEGEVGDAADGVELGSLVQ
uniref:Uncharacterized protein n=1 Tax=Arundo donax TaxID=35708 RepID=A0A0A9DWH1_ARUDO